MEDLLEDIKYLINKAEQKKENSEITEHEYHENCTILKNEIHGIDSFINIIKRTNPAIFKISMG